MRGQEINSGRGRHRRQGRSAQGRRQWHMMSGPVTFRWLAILATVFVYLQISLGVAVRVSGSGLGCGNDWPLCRGSIIPPDNLQAWVEYTHRVVGSITGLLVIGAVLIGWLTFRRNRPLVTWLATAAAGTIVIEGLLGALVVFRDLAGFLVLAHLAVALLLIGVLITAVIFSTVPRASLGTSSFQRLAVAAVVISFILLLTGAAVVATGADTVCKSWPLCGSAALHIGSGLSTVTVAHRALAGAVGIFLLAIMIFALRRQPRCAHLRTVAGVTLVLILVEAAIGYPTATTNGIALVEGLHAAVASAVWCGVVATACLANREVPSAQSSS